MKNLLKSCVIVLAIAVSISSCSSCGSSSKSGSPEKIDTPAAKVDSPKKITDTAKGAVTDTGKSK